MTKKPLPTFARLRSLSFFGLTFKNKACPAVSAKASCESWKRSEWSRRGKLFLLITCFTPIFASDLTDTTDFDETNFSIYTQNEAAQKKPFNSLQVAGPLAVAGLASVNKLNVKQGADFGADVAVDGTLFVDGGIVLDTCLVLTCTSAGQLLANGIPVGSVTDSLNVTGDGGITFGSATNPCLTLTCTTQGQLLIDNVPVVTGSGGSLIPFSSGADLSATFTTNPTIMLGFGTQSTLSTNAIYFVAPVAGTLSNLYARMEFGYSDGGGDTFNFNFILSNSVTPSINLTVPISYTVTFPTSGGAYAQGVDVGSISVAAGDLIQLQVTAVDPVPASLTQVYFLSAGVLFSPTP